MIYVIMAGHQSEIPTVVDYSLTIADTHISHINWLFFVLTLGMLDATSFPYIHGN